MTWRGLLELACRAGFAARGLVYVNIGVIALLAAVGVAPRPEGALEAFEAWADWRPGIVLLWVVGLSLYGFAGWRVLQSVFDADRQGASLKALGARAGQAISGLVYGGLAISVFGLVDALEDLREVDDQAKTQASLQKLLALPVGDLLVVGLGLFILGCGVGGIVQGFTRNFCRRLMCDRPLARRAQLLGRIGYVARGLVFLPTGVFMILAGLHARSGEAKGAGEALRWLGAQPFGPLLLALVALGLVAFGGFAFFEARYRTLGTVSEGA